MGGFACAYRTVHGSTERSLLKYVMRRCKIMLLLDRVWLPGWIAPRQARTCRIAPTTSLRL